MSNNTENRKNNFIVIYEFFLKKHSDEYKASFKKLYPKGVTIDIRSAEKSARVRNRHDEDLIGCILNEIEEFSDWTASNPL